MRGSSSIVGIWRSSYWARHFIGRMIRAFIMCGRSVQSARLGGRRILNHRLDGVRLRVHLGFRRRIRRNRIRRSRIARLRSLIVWNWCRIVGGDWITWFWITGDGRSSRINWLRITWIGSWIAGFGNGITGFGRR